MSKIFKTIIYLIVISLTFGAWLITAQRSNQSLNENGNMEIISSAFKSNQSIPSKYTCDGEDVNPPLRIKGIPEQTQSLVIIVDDPDAPAGPWIHWTLWNMDPGTREIEEDSVPQEAREGITDFEKPGYGGPCPPSGEHHYRFKVFALDQKLSSEEGAGKEELDQAMESHVIEEAELIGLYSR